MKSVSSLVSRSCLALALLVGAQGLSALPASGGDGVVGGGVVIPERDREKGVILAQDDVRLYCRETNGWTFALSQTTREAGVRVPASGYLTSRRSHL